MGSMKKSGLRQIFWRYILAVALSGVALVIITCLFIFFGVGTIHYPANYTEQVLIDNAENLKNADVITQELLTLMARYGVYGEDGEFKYGNIENPARSWNLHVNGYNRIGASRYMKAFQRDGEMLLVSYPLTLQFKNAFMRRYLPNAELFWIICVVLIFLLLVYLWSVRFAKRIGGELQELLYGIEKIERHDLDFVLGESNIAEVDRVIDGLNCMKDELQVSLEHKWREQQIRQEQISAMAHDIKTPLTIIKGNADLLKETRLTDAQYAYCEDISKGSDEIGRYIKALLLMTKDGACTSKSGLECGEITCMGDLIEGFHRDAVALVNVKGLELDWNEETDCMQDLFVKGREEDLKRAFTNVLTNAADHCCERIRVSFRVSDGDSRGDLNLLMEVSDDGPGFSEKMLKRGKEQFLMEDDSRSAEGHHGLGLYIADRIIKKSDGDVILSNLNDGENCGANVMMRLPLELFYRARNVPSSPDNRPEP
ncbi:MAG TPA: HAMP domain-containing histidine kinase [Firmicutes bacterium]|jgi:signal transduction histidine kinase|nr:HAMP domain-containing histidine kinase [Bacillota bacterium]